MAHAYTPGLTVTAATTLRRMRRLPISGEVLVEQGARVSAQQAVARTELPGNVQTVNLAGRLGVEPADIEHVLVKKKGESFGKDEDLAVSKTLFGLFTSRIKAPCDGTVESVSTITGKIILREPPIPLEVNAYVDGEVLEVLPNEGVVVETSGTFAQGIFGIGGETQGVLRMAVESPDQEITEAAIVPETQGTILVGGSHVSRKVLEKAIQAGVRGILVGGFSDQDLREFLGYDLGVAITGQEDIGITLIVTEGFGKMPMAPRTFELLSRNAGLEASINGATQIRAGVLRPEVIVPRIDNPLDMGSGDVAASHSTGLEIGTPIRVIREPYFGRLGRVTELPPELRKLESEAKVRVLELEFEDGKRAVLPRANVEMIEG